MNATNCSECSKCYNGVALVTVMGFILILSLLMLPLAMGVFQLTSSANVTKENVILTETRNSAVELVRYSLALETPTTATKVDMAKVDMAQGELELQPVNCTGTIVNLGNRPTYLYYDFEVVLAPMSKEGSTLNFTGSAVVQVLGGDLPNKVYVTHIGERK